MIKKSLSFIKKKNTEPLVFSKVVNNPDKTQMVAMLKIVAQKANQD